jgi:hypothetical protein
VEQASTKSIALFYLSAWKNTASAQAFAQLYAGELGRKYSGLKRDAAAERSTPAGVEEQIYSTGEGTVLLTTRGKLVFVAESFDLELARKLAALILDAQGTGELRMAAAQPAVSPAPSCCHPERGRRGDRVEGPAVGTSGARVGDWNASSETLEPLTAGLVRFFSNCGVMKAAVSAVVHTAK